MLADEINRAPASAKRAARSDAGTPDHHRRHDVQARRPVFVLATQNPIEQEGTYPLPEAQVDRFMLKVTVDYPQRDEERVIIERMSGDPAAGTSCGDAGTDSASAADGTSHLCRFQDQ